MSNRSVIPLIWNQIIQPGKLQAVETPDDVYTLLQNVCIENEGKAILKGKITSFLIDKVGESEEEPVEVSEVTFAYLETGKCEHMTLHHVFSPLNTLELFVDGDVPVHVTGKYTPIEAEDEYDDMEEEEEEEELTEEQIKAKVDQYLKK